MSFDATSWQVKIHRSLSRIAMWLSHINDLQCDVTSLHVIWKHLVYRISFIHNFVRSFHSISHHTISCLHAWKIVAWRSHAWKWKFCPKFFMDENSVHENVYSPIAHEIFWAKKSYPFHAWKTPLSYFHEMFMLRFFHA